MGRDNRNAGVARLHPSTNLATDPGRYSADAQWRGVYYRGQKIWFTVRQITARDVGFDVREDGQLQMSLFGAIAPVRMTTTAALDREFAVRRFSFALDPGTGPTTVEGTIEGRQLQLAVVTRCGTRTEMQELSEPPVLAVSLGRLAAAGLPRARRTAGWCWTRRCCRCRRSR